MSPVAPLSAHTIPLAARHTLKVLVLVLVLMLMLAPALLVLPLLLAAQSSLTQLLLLEQHMCGVPRV